MLKKKVVRLWCKCETPDLMRERGVWKCKRWSCGKAVRPEVVMEMMGRREKVGMFLGINGVPENLVMAAEVDPFVELVRELEK